MPGNLYSDGYVAFVDAMKAARIARGVTQAELARRLGQHQSFVSKSERRQRRIDVMEFVQIADALGVTPTALLTEVLAAIRPPGRGNPEHSGEHPGRESNGRGERGSGQ